MTFHPIALSSTFESNISSLRQSALIVHCFAIFDDDQGEFKNYEIKAEMLSLESSEGSNSGNIGLVFNYMDDENYDFVYLTYEI